MNDEARHCSMCGGDTMQCDCCRSCRGKGKTVYNRYPPHPLNNSGLVTCVRCNGSGKEPRSEAV